MSVAATTDRHCCRRCTQPIAVSVLCDQCFEDDITGLLEREHAADLQEYKRRFADEMRDWAQAQLSFRRISTEAAQALVSCIDDVEETLGD